MLNFKDAEALSDEQLQLLSGEDANADDAHTGANAGDNEPALYFEGDEGGAFADYVTAGEVVDLTGNDDDCDNPLLRARPTYDPMAEARAAPAGKRKRVHGDDDDDDDDDDEDDDGQGGSRRGGRGSARASAARAGGIVDVSLGDHTSYDEEENVDYRYCSYCEKYVKYREDSPWCNICSTDV